MTRELVDAIVLYAKYPSGHRREIVARLVRDGHLEPAEYKRLAWALEPWMKEKCSAA